MAKPIERIFKRLLVSNMQKINNVLVRCVAIDMRGYNESEKPVGIENYHMKLLAQDINECVLKLGRLFIKNK